MPRITQFSLENFRVFEQKTTFEFAPITILTGANNSGKSSLIKALVLLAENAENMEKISHEAGEEKKFFNYLDFSLGNHNLGEYDNVINKKRKEKGEEEMTIEVSVCLPFGTETNKFCDTNSKYKNITHLDFIFEIGFFKDYISKCIIKNLKGEKIFWCQDIKGKTYYDEIERDGLIAVSFTDLRKILFEDALGKKFVEKEVLNVENLDKYVGNHPQKNEFYDFLRTKIIELLDTNKLKDSYQGQGSMEDYAFFQEPFWGSSVYGFLTVGLDMDFLICETQYNHAFRYWVDCNKWMDITKKELEECKDFKRKIEDGDFDSARSKSVFKQNNERIAELEIRIAEQKREFDKLIANMGGDSFVEEMDKRAEERNKIVGERYDKVYKTYFSYFSEGVKERGVKPFLFNKEECTQFADILKSCDFLCFSEVVNLAFLDSCKEIEQTIRNLLSCFQNEVFKNQIHLIESMKSNTQRLYTYQSQGTSFNESIRKLELDNRSLSHLSNRSSHGFLNHWLETFGIADKMEINNIKGIGYEVLLVKNGKKFDLADVGYGIGQIISLIIKMVVICPYRYKQIGTSLSISGMEIPDSTHQSVYEATLASMQREEELKSLSKLELELLSRLELKREKSLILDEGNSKIIIIEEPETNLHPKLQSKIADMLIDACKKFNVQFVVETHSEYLIRKLQYWVAKKEVLPEDVNIYYFYNPEEIPKGRKQVERIRIEEDGSLDNDFGEGFFDEADNIAIEIFNLKHHKN